MFSRLTAFLSMFALVLISVFSFHAFAQDAATAGAIQPADFLTQVMQAVQGFGGLSWMAKVSAICLILVASMKVSFLNQMIWSKLPAIVQTLAAPLLALIGGLLASAGSGGLTLAMALAYVGAGGGAVILHELLDGLKGIPGLGAMYVSIIGMLEAILGGGKPA